MGRVSDEKRTWVGVDVPVSFRGSLILVVDEVFGVGLSLLVVGVAGLLGVGVQSAA